MRWRRSSRRPPSSVRNTASRRSTSTPSRRSRPIRGPLDPDPDRAARRRSRSPPRPGWSAPRRSWKRWIGSLPRPHKRSGRGERLMAGRSTPHAEAAGPRERAVATITRTRPTSGRSGGWGATPRRISGRAGRRGWWSRSVLGFFAPRVETALAGAGWETTGSQSVQARSADRQRLPGPVSYALMTVVYSPTQTVLTRRSGA